MGVKIDQFNVPVCNSFQAKVLNDQLCYEVDLNRFRNLDKTNKQLKLGFAFILDYNEDRQVTFHDDIKRNDDEFGLVSTIAESEDNEHAFIYLNTIGIEIVYDTYYGFYLMKMIYFRTSNFYWRRRIQCKCTEGNQGK